MENDRASQLTGRDLARYQRQIVLPQLGINGQRRLMSSRVLVVGAGALGSAAAAYLAAAGVGTLGLVDGDTVELSNLHRQILHDEAHIGWSKTQSAAHRLNVINSDIRIQEHDEFLSSANALDLFANYDLIVNGSDNFPARYLVNDAAVFLKKPVVDAAILRFEGQLAVFRPGLGCYRCLFPTPPSPGTVPDCAEAGIFGAVAGVLGSMQAVEALKVLLNLEESPSSAFLIYEALASRWHRMPFHRDPDCLVCGDTPRITALIDYQQFCGLGSDRTQATPAAASDAFSVTAEEAMRMMEDPHLTILDIRDEAEFLKGHLPRARQCSMEELDAPTFSRDMPVLVVCAAGVRSAYATQYLRSRGYEAWSLAGGMRTWGGAVSAVAIQERTRR